jgi:hypothetical protein
MSRSHSAILVGQVAALTATLDVWCHRCDRHGQLSTQGMMRDLGPNAPIWKAWADLNADCPNRDNSASIEKCSLYAPQLSAMFMPASVLPKRRA